MRLHQESKQMERRRGHTSPDALVEASDEEDEEQPRPLGSQRFQASFANRKPMNLGHMRSAGSLRQVVVKQHNE